jgi:beta-N-acetylhexosaminidase
LLNLYAACKRYGADVGDGKQIGTRSFGTDPAVVKQYAGAVMDGLHAAGIKGTFKHFPGLGLVNEDTHNSAGSTPSFDQMQDGLSVFSDLIANKNPDFVLVSHASTDGLTELGQPASLSPAVYQLARTYGFGGVLMTDSLGMDAIKAYVGTDDPAESQKRAALQAIQAGADMVLVEAPVASAVADYLNDRFVAGELPRDRLFEAAARVLVTKEYNPCTAVQGK